MASPSRPPPPLCLTRGLEKPGAPFSPALPPWALYTLTRPIHLPAATARCLLLLSSEMRRCEGYGGTRDRLAGKMDEGAGGQEVPRAGRADRLGKRL